MVPLCFRVCLLLENGVTPRHTTPTFHWISLNWGLTLRDCPLDCGIFAHSQSASLDADKGSPLKWSQAHGCLAESEPGLVWNNQSELTLIWVEVNGSLINYKWQPYTTHAAKRPQAFASWVFDISIRRGISLTVLELSVGSCFNTPTGLNIIPHSLHLSANCCCWLAA